MAYIAEIDVYDAQRWFSILLTHYLSVKWKGVPYQGETGEWGKININYDLRPLINVWNTFWDLFKIFSKMSFF